MILCKDGVWPSAEERRLLVEKIRKMCGGRFNPDEMDVIRECSRPKIWDYGA